MYVFDEGIRRTHDEFKYLDGQPRSWGYYRVSAVGYNLVYDGHSAVNPALHHGTAVASLIGGRTVGVAKNAFFIPVRVVNSGGVVNAATALAGINTVIDEYVEGKPHVANFSFYIDAGDTTAFETALQSLVNDHGFVVVTSANNQHKDWCNTQTPARLGDNVDGIITVGGTTNDPMDQRIVKPSWDGDTACGPHEAEPYNQTYDCGSNYGACIDIFAPGYNLLTANNSADSGQSAFSTWNIPATSFSSAIVAGAAARYLEQNPTASPGSVENYLKTMGSGVVTDHRSNTNKLLNVVPECQ